jgi:hypothetical protein
MTLLFVPLLVPTSGSRASGGRALIGFAGALCVLGVWRGVAGATGAGTLACLGSTASYGATFAYMQRFFAGRSGSAAALSAAQLVCASVELAVVAPALAGLPHWPGVPTVFALLALGALARAWRMCSTSGSSGPRNRPSPRRSPTSSRCGRWPSGPCCWPNRWGGTRLSGLSWWFGGCRGRHHPLPRPSEAGCATGPARRSRSVSFFGAPCRAFVAPGVIVRA